MKGQERQGFPASILWVLVALTLGWGFNWPMIKLALSEMPVLSFRSVCLLGGAAGLFAIAAYAGLRLRVPRGQWVRLLWWSFKSSGEGTEQRDWTVHCQGLS